MKVTQGRNQAALKLVDYYSRKHYYLWRFRESGFKPGEAKVEVTAKLAGITAQRTEIVKL
jgi:hypothetical protein